MFTWLCQKNVTQEKITIQGIGIRLSAPPAEGGPGSFTQISLRTETPETFRANDAWDVIPATFLRANLNHCSSKYVFAKAEKDYTLLLLWGYNYHSGRDEVTILSLSQKEAKRLLGKNLEEPINLKTWTVMATRNSFAVTNLK